ncbi:MAG: glyoxylate reductase [Parvibaculaceae bacterium]|jgi:lactate dehydrogenase-like 2-hydroxyacid dehydrogenase
MPIALKIERPMTMHSRPKVLVTRKLTPAAEARLRVSYDIWWNQDDRQLSGDEIIDLAHGMDALLPCVSDNLSASIIKRLPHSIKIISTFSVGYDHINIEAASQRAIRVTNTPDVVTNATADIALLLLLGAARGAAQGLQSIQSGKWARWSPTGMLGTDLSGKTLGIFGMGRIGQATAARARAFGMKIHYHNRTRLSPEKEGDATFHDTAESLYAACDIISLHAASNAETKGIINTAALAHFKPGAMLINTARGDLVDDDALIAALHSGRLSAVGLDVYANEPNIDPRYRTLQNAFLLPHLGTATLETRDAMGFRAIDNLDAFFANQPLPDPIN